MLKYWKSKWAEGVSKKQICNLLLGLMQPPLLCKIYYSQSFYPGIKEDVHFHVKCRQLPKLISLYLVSTIGADRGKEDLMWSINQPADQIIMLLLPYKSQEYPCLTVYKDVRLVYTFPIWQRYQFFTLNFPIFASWGLKYA